jgi:hypothetical protein
MTRPVSIARSLSGVKRSMRLGIDYVWHDMCHGSSDIVHEHRAKILFAIKSVAMGPPSEERKFLRRKFVVDHVHAGRIAREMREYRKANPTTLADIIRLMERAKNSTDDEVA